MLRCLFYMWDASACKGSLFSTTIIVTFARIFVNILIIFLLELKNKKKFKN